MKINAFTDKFFSPNLSQNFQIEKENICQILFLIKICKFYWYKNLHKATVLTTITVATASIRMVKRF